MASGNLWQLFKNVTEQGAKQLATVIDRQGSNYTVTMQGGGNTIVQSSAAYELQSKVFIRDGQIVSEAPDLPFVEIEV
ncbi:hypothetical protein [Psychrobacter nivimaris]|uniref:hypothetical protein n=1 Tax=Psychrobacter nivimaris TaxID=281738 RepID=UPI001918BD15|nr:hypothetical protein [Psychrobacter nivimaris]|tara:strand:- start:286 stop:519 length:234 start_codon:yes stop_codon:yes gene_type:complete